MNAFFDTNVLVAANRLQRDALLYPLDAMVLAAARSVDAPLASFDAELLDHGAVEPAALFQ